MKHALPLLALLLAVVALIVAVTKKEEWNAYPTKIIVDTIEEFNWKNIP